MVQPWLPRTGSSCMPSPSRFEYTHKQVTLFEIGQELRREIMLQYVCVKPSYVIRAKYGFEVRPSVGCAVIIALD